MSTSAGGAHPSGTVARTVAQAKINLFLRVLAREASGYHQLETLFCRLELGDDVTVRTNVHGRSLDCAGDVIPAAGVGPTEQNLAWRAATAYAVATGWPNGWAIEITKRIPVGGGLGGGSADAGAVLRCLNALAPEPLSQSALLALAAPLGADVPFLTLDAPLAVGWGRGERLLTLPSLPARDVALVVFPFGVSTAEAYGWLDDERTADTPEASAMTVDAVTTWLGVSRIAHNDFESVVGPRYPAISASLAGLRSTMASLRDSFSIVMLAGSGATVFLISSTLAPYMLGAHEPSSRIVTTRTATRVVAVEVSD
jgi:4-diphosphocytidyl-2-C-methyl-D-erythritol kinase